MPRIKFAVQSYESRSLPLSAQRLTNLYVEQAPEDAHTQAALFGTPGLKRFITVGNGPIRGMLFLNNLLFVVSGARVYTVSQSGDVTLVGEISGTADVDMVHNGTQVFIRAGGDADNSYIVTPTTVTQINDVDFVGASSVTYQDGYFIYTETGAARFYISSLNDGLSYDALDFASAEGDPDNAIRVFSDHRELWVFGTESTEIWFNADATDFPFKRANGAYLERGCSAAGSVTKIDNTVFWVGDDGIVYRADGYTPIRVSTHGVESVLARFESLADIIAFEYTQDGHKFYVLTKPNEFTLVYDVATGFWHNRESHGRKDWRARCYALFFGKHLVGDATSGKLFELDPDTYDEDGDPLIARAVTPTIWGETNRTVMSRYQVDLEAGVGLTSGQGEDPKIMLRWSDDGGRTWSNQLWTTLGKKGQNQVSAEWRRLGMFERRVMEVSIADPIKRVLLGSYGDFVEGRGNRG